MSTALGEQTPTILVVDDEPDMRDLARMLLEIDGLTSSRQWAAPRPWSNTSPWHHSMSRPW